ncbi:unnamed protein product [Phytomonas sp. EM1]|nr:unnamed protein product [Phytomonas sp. EM1]|eukprot:CCW65744.1 unnamed protein product [Phytomonas sp. isolate EM1]
MPREVIEHLTGNQQRGVPPSSADPWRQRIDDLSEDILCFPVSTSVLEMRLKPLAKHWTQLQEQRRRRSRAIPRNGMQGDGITGGRGCEERAKNGPRTGEGPSSNRRVVAITLPLLCRMCLWEHEYGADMACEMMLLYLERFSEAEVRVISRNTWRRQRAKPSEPTRSRGACDLEDEVGPAVDVKDLVVVFPL